MNKPICLLMVNLNLASPTAGFAIHLQFAKDALMDFIWIQLFNVSLAISKIAKFVRTHAYNAKKALFLIQSSLIYVLLVGK
jgi:hypothetical protein